MDKYLHTIEAKDLLFGREDCDVTSCKVVLDDYDWMDYHFYTQFKLEAEGILDVDINASGCTIATMTVQQYIPGKGCFLHRINFPIEIFDQESKKYLNAWIKAQTEDIFAFAPESYIIEFYNAIIEGCLDWDYSALAHNMPDEKLQQYNALWAHCHSADNM